MEDHPKEQHHRGELKQFRRALRKDMTPAEVALWKLLKNKNLAGRKFRRQHQAGPYILDFYCPAEKLVVELDGEVHRNLPRWEYDEERTRSLQEHRIRVIRYILRVVMTVMRYLLTPLEPGCIVFGGWIALPCIPSRSRERSFIFTPKSLDSYYSA